MEYLAEVIAQARPAARPKHYEELLFHPICDDPNAQGAQSFSNWEFEHASTRRFYVGGMLWFLGVTGGNSQSLSGFKEEAVQAVQQRTDWAKMPNSNTRWTEQIARQQFNLARNHSPLYFQKAAIIIMACELAVEEILKNGRQLQDIETAEDIYRYMSIVPACWNIDDYNGTFYEEHIAQTPGAIDTLRAATGQRQKTLFRDLATGHTVSYATAKPLKDSIDGDPSIKANVGKVRAKSGKKTLGKKRASDYETCDCG